MSAFHPKQTSATVRFFRRRGAIAKFSAIDAQPRLPLVCSFYPTTSVTVGVDLLVKSLLVLEALICLWFGRAAWKEGAGERLSSRFVGPSIWCAAAAVILFAVVR